MTNIARNKYGDLFKGFRAAGWSAVEADAQVRLQIGDNPAEYRLPSLINDEARAMMRNRTKTAGELYDEVAGRRRWAWVDGDSIQSVGYHATDPNEMDEQKALGRKWLPVSHVDSEPFDLATQWRQKPVITIEGDKVLCTFPIVNQSEVA